MKPLNPNRFDLLAGYARLPGTHLIAEELEWYEAGSERLLGMVLRDRIDDDFGWVILGRDKVRRFRAIKFAHSLGSQKAARLSLRVELAKSLKLPSKAFYQGDEKGEVVDFFKPVVTAEKLNKAFRELSTKGSYPAGKLLEEMLHWYEDVDGNFLEQFQTTAFDARLWELYMFATFNELGYAFDREFEAPDFLCVGPLGKFFIEATTVNPSNPPINLGDLTQNEYYYDYVPKKFGSALYSKLKKRYWEREHVKGLPLAFAIQDFHDWQSMVWSMYGLSEFLFGARKVKYIHNNEVKFVTEKIEYRFGEEVSAGFFSYRDAENISCVIANPGGTIAKFNRIGLQAGFGEGKTVIVRSGFCLKVDDDPQPFTYTVGETDYIETWVEGLAVFHNPFAKHPLPFHWIPGAAHFFIEDGELVGHAPDFHPIGSTSFNLHATNALPQSADVADTRKFIEEKISFRFKDQ